MKIIIVGLISLGLLYFMAVPDLFNYKSREFFQGQQRQEVSKYLWIMIILGMFVTPKVAIEGYRGYKYVRREVMVLMEKRRMRKWVERKLDGNEDNVLILNKEKDIWVCATLIEKRRETIEKIVIDGMMVCGSLLIILVIGEIKEIVNLFEWKRYVIYGIYLFGVMVYKLLWMMEIKENKRLWKRKKRRLELLKNEKI